MIKILVACDNDILFNKFNNNTIKVTKVEQNVKKIIKSCKTSLPDLLIVDFNKKELTYSKIIDKLYKLNINKYITISEAHNRMYICFSQIHLCSHFIKHIENIIDPLEQNMLDRIVIDMLWELHFNLSAKGTKYLKDSIYLAYNDKSLLLDTNKLVSQIAKMYSEDEKNIRNNIDNALNLAFKYENLQYDIDFFNGYYDGRKISLKYFMSLAINYINIKMNKNSSDLLSLL